MGDMFYCSFLSLRPVELEVDLLKNERNHRHDNPDEVYYKQWEETF